MSSAPPVFIWVRATVDWDDDDAYLHQVDAAFRRKIDVWDTTFTMPYNRFRRVLRDIARRNHAGVRGARQASWDEIPDGAIVLPVDDDDWFAPEVAETLGALHDPEATAFRWPSTFLEIPTTAGHHLHLVRRTILPSTPPKQFCTTNNYALVKRPGVELIAKNHMRAGEVLEHGAGVRMSDARLSLMNRTLSSQTTLGFRSPRLTRGHAVRKYRRYRRLYDRPHLEVPAWSLPYVAMMAELMEQIELRRAGQRP